jgi:hypothetical protein
MNQVTRYRPDYVRFWLGDRIAQCAGQDDSRWRERSPPQLAHWLLVQAKKMSEYHVRMCRNLSECVAICPNVSQSDSVTPKLAELLV